MPRPTPEQLRRINKFSQTKLEEDQVFVFRSLCADTLPVKRYGWCGEYSILFANNMLKSLKKDYRQGVGLLASHNNNRLPFGRTFDAELQIDDVSGNDVNTLYVDHYIVTHLKDEDGNKVPLRTEINGMTTEDIANHIAVGHTFDTSIGFSMDKVKCSVCGNDLRDWEKCEHIPGRTYKVEGSDDRVRCDIIAEEGEGLENSLVYAGAVDRALIQHSRLSVGGENTQSFQGDVNLDTKNLYNVDELKNVPLDAVFYCNMSKGSLSMYSNVNERRDYKTYLEAKECEEMSKTNEVKEENLATATISMDNYVERAEYNKVVGDNTELTAKLGAKDEELAKSNEELAKAQVEIEQLSVKAQLADSFTEDLIQETLNAGVASRGNAFSKERFEKYLRTLSVDEIKEEFSAFKTEFPGNVEEARVTAKEAELGKKDEVVVEMSADELRQEAGKLALAEFNAKGGDLAELTKQKYNELLSKQSNK